MDRRLYILTRSDLGPSYAAVQAGHAVAAWIKNHPNSWDNEYLIYLSVDNEDQLMFWEWKLKTKDINSVGFKEPDLNDSLTALAAVSDGKVFKSLPLL